MSLEECVAFDDRARIIIKDYANYWLPTQKNSKNLELTIFEDILTARIKKDPFVVEILAGIKAFQPVVTKQPSKVLPISEKPRNSVSDELLATLLGYESEDSDTHDSTDLEDFSEEEASAHDQIAGKKYSSDESVTSSNTCADSKLPSHPMRHQLPQEKLSAQTPIHKKTSDERRPFRTDIKSTTRSKVLKLHLEAEKKISDKAADYTLASKDMPRWHVEYKKRLQERTQRGNVDSSEPKGGPEFKA